MERYRSDKEEIDAFNIWEKRLGVEPKRSYVQWESGHTTEIKEKEKMNDNKINATIVPTQPEYKNPPVPRHDIVGSDLYDSFSDDPSFDNDGEYLPDTVSHESIAISQRTPRYIEELMRLEMNMDDRLALLSTYESATNAKSFKQYINKEVEVYGAIIWDHPPYKGKDGEDHDGYQQIRLITMEQGEIVVICASAGALANHVLSILALRGWFIWPEPVKYLFTQDEKTNSFQLTNASRVKAMLNALKKGVK